MSPEADLTDLGDAALVVAVARYRQDALAEAYRRHAGAVHGLAGRILRDQTLAEEVTQEVFLRLWEDPERYDAGRGTLRSYLLTQTHGRAVDLVRSEQARRNREEKAPKERATAAYDLEREIIDLETSEQVSEALSALDEGQRSAIVLAYFGGYTYREVARILDEPEGTVKSRIRSGLSRLRGTLAPVGG